MDKMLLLVVEDDALIRTMIEAALEEAGFGLVLACSGVDAMRELDAGAERFAAILSDIRLGSGPDGWTVARHARELVPEIPVAYMSGDSGRDWSAQGVPNSVFIGKPFAVAQIITAVSTLITEADTRRVGVGQPS